MTTLEEIRMKRRLEYTAIMREVENTPSFIEDFNSRISEGKSCVKLDVLYSFIFEMDEKVLSESPLFIKKYIEIANDKLMDMIPARNMKDLSALEDYHGEYVIKVSKDDILNIMYEELEAVIKRE